MIVAFYEPRDRLEDNAALKTALRSLAGKHAQLDVLAIGDVASFDFMPARSIVRRVVGALTSRHDLEILLDWRGALTEPPFSLVRGSSNVCIVDAQGAIALRRVGIVPDDEIATICARLETLLGAGTARVT